MSEEKKDIQPEEKTEDTGEKKESLEKDKVEVEEPKKAPEEKEEKAEEKAPEEKEEKAEEKAPEEKKGDPRMPKSTKSPKPEECASCGKPIAKRLWYYKNMSFYCTKKCYKRKLEADRKQAEEAAQAEEKDNK